MEKSNHSYNIRKERVPSLKVVENEKDIIDNNISSKKDKRNIASAQHYNKNNIYSL